MTDVITILSHSNLRLAKRWRVDGAIEPYEDAKQYRQYEKSIDSLQDLSRTLFEIEQKPNTAVIRGQYKGDEVAAQDPDYQVGFTRRTKANFEDVPHHWMLVDIDKYKPSVDAVLQCEQAIEEMVEALLPEAFHHASYHWQLSNTAGHKRAEGMLKVHLWFWLKTPATSDQLKAWAQRNHVPIDLAVFNPVQLHYTAAPVFEKGVTDPVPRRSGFMESMVSDEVDLDLNTLQITTTGSAKSEAGIPASGSAEPIDIDSIEFLGTKLGWSIDDAREVLFDIDPNSNREAWLQDLAALHHELDGSDEGLALAIEWSSQADNFDSEKDVRDRWKSFGTYRGGKSVTATRLLKRQKDANAHRKYDAVDKWKKKLAEPLEQQEIQERIAKEISEDPNLDDLGREVLAKELQNKLFGVTGVKFQIADMRRLIAPKKSMRAAHDDLPEWMEGWVYVTDDDQFFRQDSAEWLTVQGFNACFNRECPRDSDGDVLKNASVIALEDFGIDTVTQAMYLPWAPPIFVNDGVRCVNIYRPSSTPSAAPRLTSDDRQAVEIVREHLSIICDGREEVIGTMMDWIAHNVQNPGVKIRWMPLIKGVEGDGKTFIGTLLAAVMGRPNIKNVSSTVLGTSFTGWAHGGAVAVLEEIRLAGHSRHDIHNTLKPFISNDSVEIHPKGRDPFDAINTTNYIAFTNHEDALPINDNDRRNMVIFTPFDNIEGLLGMVIERTTLGEGRGRGDVLGAYFERLAAAISGHRAGLRKFFLDYDISDQFKPNGRAPLTAEKSIMITANLADEQMAVNEALEIGGEGVAKDVFASACMSLLLQALDENLALNTQAVSKFYAKAGFRRLPKKIFWNGRTHIIWVRGLGIWNNERVKKELDLTLLGMDPDLEGFF